MDKAQEQAVLSSMEGLLDKNLDDVEDLPEWLDRIPAGFYKLKVEVENKVVEVKKDDKSDEKTLAPVIQFVYTVLNTLELEKDTETPPKDGSKFNVSYFMHKEPDKAIASIKASYKEVAASLGIGNMSELVKKLHGMEVGAKVKAVQDKKDDTKFYFRVSNAAV